jgi:hypothetical protein
MASSFGNEVGGALVGKEQLGAPSILTTPVALGIVSPQAMGPFHLVDMFSD